MIVSFIFCVLAVFAVTGPALAGQVKKGDKVMVDVTCRLPDGKVLLTTQEAVANDPEIAKAGVFFHLKKYEPLELFAGSGYGGPSWEYLVPLKSEVGAKISKKITGMKTGETRTVRISTRRLQGLEHDQGYVKLARKVVEPKVRKMSLEGVKKQFGRIPKQGETVQINNSLSATVESIDKENNVVTVRLHIQDGAIIKTKFGNATLSNKNDEYYMRHFHSEVGHLVGVGPFLAQISEVNEKTFVLDYRYPFGGRELTCDICVKSIKKNGSERNSK